MLSKIEGLDTYDPITILRIDELITKSLIRAVEELNPKARILEKHRLLLKEKRGKRDTELKRLELKRVVLKHNSKVFGVKVLLENHIKALEHLLNKVKEKIIILKLEKELIENVLIKAEELVKEENEEGKGKKRGEVKEKKEREEESIKTINLILNNLIIEIDTLEELSDKIESFLNFLNEKLYYSINELLKHLDEQRRFLYGLLHKGTSEELMIESLLGEKEHAARITIAHLSLKEHLKNNKGLQKKIHYSFHSKTLYFDKRMLLVQELLYKSIKGDIVASIFINALKELLKEVTSEKVTNMTIKGKRAKKSVKKVTKSVTTRKTIKRKAKKIMKKALNKTI